MEPNPAFELTMGERFQQESMIRVLQECKDPEVLRERAVYLLKAWMAARASARGFMFSTLPEPWQKAASAPDQA
jgi:hypothetical protein